MTEAWYAVYTAPRAEYLADRTLRALGYKTFFPHTVELVQQSKRKSRFVKVAYLSNYLFVAFRPERRHLESAYQVNNAVVDEDGRKKASLVMAGTDANGDKAPFPIPMSVMNPLMELCDHVSGQVIFVQDVPRTKWNWAVGDRVRIAEGNALFGLFAAVEEIFDNGESLRVRLERSLLGKDVATIRATEVQEVVKVENKLLTRAETNITSHSNI